MVEVEKLLVSILELRKDNFTGEDIKNVVESILMAKSYIEPKPIDPNAKTAEQILKDWKGE